MSNSSQELQRHALDYWQIIRNRLGLIFLSFLLVFAAAAIITYIMPRKYRGLVEMVIERNSQDTRVIGQLNDPIASAGSNFLKTQFEIITKRKTLDRVVDKLNLVQRWNLPAQGKKYAAGRLLGNLDVQSSLNSDFISIVYYDEDPRLAAEIANAIAESYTETRLEVDNERADRAIRQLSIQIAAKQKLTDEARDKMIAIKKELGIVEIPGDSSRAAGSDMVNTIDNATLLDATRDVYQLEKEIQQMRAQFAKLQTLEGDDLIRQAGELRVENETIKSLGPTYQNLLLKQESLAGSGLGRRHPTMVGLANEISKARELLLDAANDYRNNLVFRLEIAEKQFDQAKKLNQEHREKSLQAQTDNQQYLQAKQEWESLNFDLLKLRETKAAQEIEKNISKTPTTVHQPAEPDNAPAKPNVRLNLMLGAVVGLMFGFGLAFFLEYLDTTVKSIDEVERLLEVPVLAVIPKNVGVIHRSAGLNPDAEAYRILRTNIEFNRKNPDANVISVASGGSSEGKSTTMVNLATVCAQGGYTTLLIDGDIRRPRLHTFFDLSNQVGLSNYLSSNLSLQEVVEQTGVENLYLLPSGVMPADSSGLLNSRRFQEMLVEVKSRFDLVLIDSPPILGVSDASVLAAEADMTLLVVQHRKLPRQMLQRVRQSIEAVGGNIIGVVLNNVDIHSDSTYGYYTSYYSYYSGDPNDHIKTPVRGSSPAVVEKASANGQLTAAKPSSSKDVF